MSEFESKTNSKAGSAHVTGPRTKIMKMRRTGRASTSRAGGVTRKRMMSITVATPQLVEQSRLLLFSRHYIICLPK